MAITTTILDRTVFGNKVVVYGKSVLSAGSSSGDVVTSLNYVEMFLMDVAGDTQKGCSVNETLPLSSGTVTAVTETNNQTFYWEALGH